MEIFEAIFEPSARAQHGSARNIVAFSTMTEPGALPHQDMANVRAHKRTGSLEMRNPPKKTSSIHRVKLTTCSHLMTRRSDFLISAVEPGCKDSKSHPWESGLKFSTLLGCAWYIGMKYMKAGGNPTQSPWIKVKEPQQNHKLVGEQMLDRPSPKQIRKRIGENAPKKDWNNQPVSACFLSMLASHCCEASAWTSSEVARAEKLPLLSWVKAKSLAHKNEEINWLTLKYFWN